MLYLQGFTNAKDANPYHSTLFRYYPVFGLLCRVSFYAFFLLALQRGSAIIETVWEDNLFWRKENVAEGVIYSHVVNGDPLFM